MKKTRFSDWSLQLRVATLTALAVAVVLPCSGCKKAKPPVVQASGVITLNGQPLPRARLELTPTFSGFSGELLATAEAGDDGTFRLSNGLGDGICVGTYKVTVHEMPPPEELQEYRPDTPARQRAYFEKLSNRPIPERYSSLATTPLTVTFEENKTQYEIALKR